MQAAKFFLDLAAYTAVVAWIAYDVGKRHARRQAGHRRPR